MTPETSASTLVIFGASGDLTRRKLIPALHSLFCEGLLPEDLVIQGVGRTQLSDFEFRNQLREAVQRYARLKPRMWDDFAEKIFYLTGEYDSEKSYQQLKKGTQVNQLFYTAVPPHVFPTIVEHLGKSGLNKSSSSWRRIVIEKPFGRDRDSARQLNAVLHTVFDESQIFRIDHYLGKETVQNILTLRFANAVFEPLWNLKYIDHVQILVAEEDGIEHRGGYYDQAGVLRDIFQNHLLQLLTLIAMEPPPIWQADVLRDEKVKLLRAVQPVERSLRGQYGRDAHTSGYLQEKGVAADSQTSTFAAVRLLIDNWRWKGVPFYLLSGKRLKAKSTSIVIQFKSVPHLLFSPSKRDEVAPNILSLCIQPNEGMRLGIQAKKPGSEMRVHPVDIDYQYAQDFDRHTLPDAYERLLLDFIQGDASLFARADEIDLAWKIMDPVLESWSEPDGPPLQIYKPGTWGPEETQAFIRQDGRHWYYLCNPWA